MSTQGIILSRDQQQILRRVLAWGIEDGQLAGVRCEVASVGATTATIDDWLAIAHGCDVWAAIVSRFRADSRAAQDVGSMIRKRCVRDVVELPEELKPEPTKKRVQASLFD